MQINSLLSSNQPGTPRGQERLFPDSVSPFSWGHGYLCTFCSRDHLESPSTPVLKRSALPARSRQVLAALVLTKVLALLSY